MTHQECMYRHYTFSALQFHRELLHIGCDEFYQQAEEIENEYNQMTGSTRVTIPNYWAYGQNRADLTEKEKKEVESLKEKLRIVTELRKGIKNLSNGTQSQMQH